MSLPDFRLRKHADYQRVYQRSRKHFSPSMTYFFAERPTLQAPTAGPRVGLTVGKVLGNAVERNRIKRRMRECVRRHALTVTYPVDVILHPRRAVLELEAQRLDAEVAQIFATIQKLLTKAAVQ